MPEFGKELILKCEELIGNYPPDQSAGSSLYELRAIKRGRGLTFNYLFTLQLSTNRQNETGKQVPRV